MGGNREAVSGLAKSVDPTTSHEFEYLYDVGLLAEGKPVPRVNLSPGTAEELLAASRGFSLFTVFLNFMKSPDPIVLELLRKNTDWLD